MSFARSVEWLVAWRYLRDKSPSRWVVFILGLALLGLAGVFFALEKGGLVGARTMVLGVPVRVLAAQAKQGLALAGILVTIFGACLLFFNLFTSISILGVFLGVTSLIVVLAVMSGFEKDLRNKILGNNAHILIKGKNGSPVEDRRLMRLVSGHKAVPGVEAVAPFIQGEVILTGPKSHAGVFLRGIDPVKADRVSDLGRNIVAGVLDNLLYPERLKYLYFPPEGFVMNAPGLPAGEASDGRPSRPVEDRDAAARGPRAAKSVDAGASSRPTGRETTAAAKVVGLPAGGMGPDSRPAPIMGKKGGPLERLMDRPSADFQALMGPSGLAGTVPSRAGPLQPAPLGAGEGGASNPKGSDGLGAGLDVQPDAMVGTDLRTYPGIIVGQELAKTIGLRLGQTVDVVTTDTEEVGPLGPVPSVKTFRVAGIFYSGHYEFDSKYAYVLLSEAQAFLAKKGKISGLEIRVSDIHQVKKVARELAERLNRGPDSRLVVLTWREIHKNLFSALALERLTMFLVLAIIVCVASFSIGANLIMVVRRKKAEIATLKAMGADDGMVNRIFVINGLYVGFIGTALGLVFGLGICVFLAYGGISLNQDVYYFSRFPVEVRFFDILAVCLASLGISFVATVYPAWQAARLHPVEALRDE